VTHALNFRAVEMHGRRMWERAAIARTLRFMKEYDLDTLVLHESDIITQIVYPRAYFDPYALWSDMPSRRGENAIFNNRAYVQDILRMAGEAGISVYLNVKEIGFSDEVLAIRPELSKDGAICPCEPFWLDYVAAKTDELFTDFPELAGLIVSFGSQESRASKVQNRCTCARCRATSLEDWYCDMIACMHGPAARHGKTLAVRDFAYKPEDHAPLVAAMRRAPADVVFCIKAQPHDFYLTFPDNPAIGLLPRAQWVEYDVMGQFSGWGVIPCYVGDDLARRAANWRRAGVSGIILRIEWERLNDLDSFDNISEANLMAGALLASGRNADPADIAARWLRAHGLDAGCAGLLAEFLARTPAIVVAAAYTNGFVTADNSMLPRSIERAWWGAEVRDSLVPWDASKAGALDLDRSRLETYLDEKRRAVDDARRLVGDLAERLRAVDAATAQAIDHAFALMVPWTDGHRLCVSVCLYARWIGSGRPDVGDRDYEALTVLLDELAAFADWARSFARSSATHHAKMLVDPRRADDVLRGGRAVLATRATRTVASGA
jgi:hypothetical protein